MEEIGKAYKVHKVEIVPEKSSFEDKERLAWVKHEDHSGVTSGFLKLKNLEIVKKDPDYFFQEKIFREREGHSKEIGIARRKLTDNEKLNLQKPKTKEELLRSYFSGSVGAGRDEKYFSPETFHFNDSKSHINADQ